MFQITSDEIQFSYHSCCRKGSYHSTLSRALLQLQSTDSCELQEVVEAFMSAVIEAIPASTDHLEQIRQAQQEDPTLSQVLKYCQEGWPAKHHIKGLVKQYWCVRSELCIHNELLLSADRIVIPTCLQQDVLSRIHQGHQGIVKCRLRAHTSVW